MSYVRKVSVAITTATDGSATAHTAAVNGKISAVRYVKDGTTPFASTADLTVTTEDTAQAVYAGTNINATTLAYPVAAAAKNGVASTLTEVPLCVDNERIKIIVAQGGNTKIGTFEVILN